MSLKQFRYLRMPDCRRMKIKLCIVERSVHERPDILRRNIACRRKASFISVECGGDIDNCTVFLCGARADDIIELVYIRVKQCSRIISVHHGEVAIGIVKRLNIHFAIGILLADSRKYRAKIFIKSRICSIDFGRAVGDIHSERLREYVLVFIKQVVSAY